MYEIINAMGPNGTLKIEKHPFEQSLNIDYREEGVIHRRIIDARRVINTGSSAEFASLIKREILESIRNVTHRLAQEEVKADRIDAEVAAEADEKPRAPLP